MRSNVNNTVKTLQAHADSGAKLLAIMIGPPGSGKSTLIKTLRESGLQFAVASTDEIIDQIALKDGLTYSQAFHKIDWKWANSKFNLSIKDAIGKGSHLFIDRTNMGEKSRKGYLESVKNQSYLKVALNMQVSDKELERRLAERAASTGKFIPKKVLEDMLAKYKAPSKHEGFDVIIDVLTDVHA